MDISPETVGTLSQIMLSQAQEVFVIKATAGVLLGCNLSEYEIMVMILYDIIKHI